MSTTRQGRRRYRREQLEEQRPAGTTVDFGDAQRVLRTRRGGFSARVSSRSLVVCAGLASLLAVVLVLSLGQGSFSVHPVRVVEVLLGGGTRQERLVVTEWRMPRAVMAVLAGAALGASGALFQSLTRNPLGSPDVIGFTNGAFAGAVVSIIVLGGQGWGTPVGALVGGVATALVVYALAYRRGVQGFRLIIVGIAVGAMLSSLTTWLMLKAKLELAMSAAVWGTGSLNGVGWGEVFKVACVLAVLAPAVLLAGPVLRILDLGDDAAGALGVPVRWSGLWLTVLGVALTAVVTAYCGLIAFIALSAPQLARRAVRSAGIPLLPSAFMGAALLVCADWVAQHGLGEREVPVGVVTVSIGGCYLLYLLVRESRRS